MPMRCYYEELGVERRADEAAIRSAYRKLALKWHPDKNQHNAAEAEERFKALQAAYEVLSDKHERAWYDSHRESILRGEEDAPESGGPRRPESEVNLWPYFQANAFSGFGDGARSFFGVYSRLFETLAQQEEDACVNQEKAAPDLPTFGTAKTPLANVRAFYDFWTGFVTAKEFAWCDQHNPAQAPNRRVRRAMEEENKRLRKRVRREYMERVRALASHIKRRDPRVAEMQRIAREEEAAAQKKREADKLRRQQERREKLAAYQEPEWVTAGASEEEDALDDDFWNEDANNKDESGQFECIVCEKVFKSQRQLENHEKSKKHLENLAQLREMLLEDEQLAADFEGINIGGLQEPKLAEPESKHVSKKKVSKKKRRKNKEKQYEEEQDRNLSGDIELNEGDQNATAAPIPGIRAQAASEEHRDESEDEQLGNENEDEESLLIRMAASHSQPRQMPSLSNEEEEEEEDENDDDEDAFLRRMAAAQSSMKSKESPEDESAEEGSDEEDEEILLNRMASAQREKSPPTMDSSDSIGDSNYGLPENGKDEVDNSTRVSKTAIGTSQPRADEGEDEEVEIVTTHAFVASKMSKSKASKKARKAKKKGMEGESDLQCQLCGEAFGSRNALFKHIRDTGHAAYK